jgi:phosphatidylserine decarboxylase
MITHSDTFILSKRGWLPIAFAATFFLFFAMTQLTFFMFISGALLIAFLILFRNPERSSTLNEPLTILSCIDGVVLGIEEVRINERAMKKVTVLNSLWDVSLLRSPYDGEMEGCKIRYGLSLGLHHPLSENLNEKAALSFKSLEGNEIFIEHTSAQSCFSLRIDADVGEKIREGSRYGFLARGRTVCYLPDDVHLDVHAGSDVHAGETVLGRFAA